MRVSTNLFSSWRASDHKGFCQSQTTSVGVPALPSLAAELARLDFRLQLRRRLISLVPGCAVPIHARVVGDVQAGEVAKAEWTHRPVEAFFDSDVDVFERCNTGIEQPVRLLGCGMEDSIDDEAVDLLVDEHRRAAHFASQCHGA